jgi:Carboxypeptidase regulatory-like domain
MYRAILAVAGFALLGASVTARPGSPPISQNVNIQGGRGREGGGPVPATGTGVIIGRVVEGNTTSAVAGTVVTITGAGGGVNQRVRVDSSGRFLFRDLPVGEFSVVATKSGYVGGAAGQRSPNGPTRPVELAAGERVSDLTLRLWQAGVIAGTIVDEAGDPIVGIKVTLAERRLINGRRRLAPGQNFAATTDDRGMYRFGSVPPGDYYVVARTSEEEVARGLMSLVAGDPGVIFSLAGKAMGGGRPQDLLGFEAALSVYPPIFHPSAALPSQATVVTITSGEVREGVDIRMKVVPLARLAGTFAGLGSEAPGAVQVRLVLPDADGSEFEVARAIDTSNGKFDFLAVPSGRYTLRAYQAAAMARPAPGAQGGVVVAGRGGRGSGPPPVSADPAYWASMPIELNGLESQNVSLMMQRGFAIRGRIELDGTAPRPEADQLERMVVTLAAEDLLTVGMNVRAKVESDGTFRTGSVPPGKYRLRVSPVGVWFPKSAMVEGRDVIDEVLEVETADVSNIVITLSDRPLGSVGGTVRTARGDPDPDALVAIFPADPRLRTDLSGTGRRLRLARTTKSGLYRIPGLPAGEYLIVAGGDELFDNWLEASALQALSRRATPIEIGDGTAKNQELKRGSVR